VVPILSGNGVALFQRRCADGEALLPALTSTEAKQLQGPLDLIANEIGETEATYACPVHALVDYRHPTY
jgi:hypothetical protein